MADKFSKYEQSADKFSKYETPQEQSFLQKLNPLNPEGYLASTVGTPGSRTDATIRGAINSSTFGFGDEASAALRSLVPGSEGYKALRDTERNRNTAAAEAHPGYDIAGNVIGAVPQGLQVARGAVQAGTKMIPQMLGAGKVAARQGVVTGLGQTEDITNPAQVVEDVGASTALSGVTNALGIPVAKGVGAVAKTVGGKINDMLPTGELATRTRLATAPAGEALSSEVIPPAPPKIGSTVSDWLKSQAPTIGAVGNIAIDEFSGKNSADWSTDPYSAAAETAASAGQGALLGLGAQKAMKLPGIITPLAKQAGNAVLGGVESVGKWAGQKADELVTTGKTAGPVEAIKQSSPYGKLTTYLQKSQSSPNAGVTQAAQQMDATVAKAGNTADAKRQVAMAGQSTPEGRAVTNDTSKVHDFSELDDYMKRMRGGSDLPTEPRPPHSGGSANSTMSMDEPYIDPSSKTVDESIDKLFNKMRGDSQKVYDYNLQNNFAHLAEKDKVAKNAGFNNFKDFLIKMQDSNEQKLFNTFEKLNDTLTVDERKLLGSKGLLPSPSNSSMPFNKLVANTKDAINEIKLMHPDRYAQVDQELSSRIPFSEVYKKVTDKTSSYMLDTKAKAKLNKELAGTGWSL